MNTLEYRHGPVSGPQTMSQSHQAQTTAKISSMEWHVSTESSNGLLQGVETQGDVIVKLLGVKARHAADMPLVLDIESLSIYPGESIALIGPSGAGKTTLLRLLNGYVPPESGRVKILGKEIDAALGQGRHYREFWPRDMRRRIGFVFQDFSLVERASVFQNVLWGRLGRVNPLWSLLGQFSKSDKQAAMAAIEEVDLLPQTTQRVDTLSGGQQQRVGVARVLAQEAEIILADEPVSNLDPALADDVLALLSQVSRRRNAALIMSLHQPALAQKYADRIIGLNQGRVVYDGPSAAFDRQALQMIYQRDGNRASNGLDEIDLLPTNVAAESIQWPH